MEGWLRVAGMAAAATVIVPVILLSSPFLSITVQVLEGCWLSAACWLLVNTAEAGISSLETSLEQAVGLSSPARSPARAQSPQASKFSPGYLSPSPTLSPGNRSLNRRKKGGPLELIVSLPALPVVWIEVILRKIKLPRLFRFMALNLVAYISSPIWFFVISGMHLLLLVAVSVISFGILLPWTGPLIATLSFYIFLVPVWTISTYICTSGPMIASLFILPFLDNSANLSRRFIGMTGLSFPFSSSSKS
mmetsp:Transcript_48087/g.150891  ORF Transcript_48087/g.150891 Transcript_48087/m.150891 type:complete len:249 (-) Transcript_48087:598-1344(-)